MVIFALRTTSNREDQVFDFVTANIEKKGLPIDSIIKAHGMRGYIFVEAENREFAEECYQKVPYARGLLPKPINYQEIEHMLEHVKIQINIIIGDVVEIISGPFKREEAKVTRLDLTKEEVVVELLEAAVPIPITVKMDSVKVIRREESSAKEIMNREQVPEERVEVKQSVEETLKDEGNGELTEIKKKKDKRVDDDVDLSIDDDFNINL
jgi:transcriptional antiterminator NusG